MGALAQENAMLRREVQEVRDSFAKLMIGADALPTGAALPDASWLAAQPPGCGYPGSQLYGMNHRKD